MKSYSAVIFTLATLAANNTNQSAMAEPAKPDEKISDSANIVVPVQIKK